MEKSIPIRNEGGEASDIIQTSEWRSEAEEYEMISTPTAFHKSRAMVEREATVKRKKRRRKRKRMNNWLKLSQFHPHHPNPLEAGKPAFDSEQGKDECVRTVEVSKWDFIEISDNVPQKLAVDIDVKENKMIELVQAVKCRTEGIGDKAGSKEAIDMSSSSSVDDGLISNISSGTRIGDIMSAKGTINVDGEMVRTELKTLAAEETVDAGMKEMHSEKAKCVEIVKLPGKSAKSTMLRNHLQKPRYFDPPNGSWTRCLSCGEDHPAAENRMLQKHVKACFLCRRLQHIGKHCSQKIRCYICNDFGHLSCVKLPDASPTEVSCYTCSQSGHFGSHARRVHAEMRSVGSSSAPNRGPQNDAKGATQESLIVNIIQ
ncbi:uncharacterized protein [Gossypium hirsutum]|uniref:Uncharacterized protein isoform X11 n=1 Tax=Gossypium hirsutum TaxID=3635 RepID=A0A1U8IWP4_GOSHI|nr:uncharacterized protein LOC107899200 isoform X11 [Gossypium hirsutum]